MHFPPPSHDDKRMTVRELNFFAYEKLPDSSIDADGNKCSDIQRTELEVNVNTGLHLLTTNTSSDRSMVDDGISPVAEDVKCKNGLVVLQAKLERMNTENQHLRDMLNQVSSKYQALQMCLVNLMQNTRTEEIDKRSGNGGTMVPRQFMDLDLANNAHPNEPLLSSSEANSSCPVSQESGGSKIRRLNPGKDDNQSEATMRKTRVSVRARTEETMIPDGCAWKKYGEKMSKGNRFPRAYYRCSMVACCPVQKQVQKCAEDESILITNYQGDHSHILPPAAMAWASMTTSAARMLLSESISSADHSPINLGFLPQTVLLGSSHMATISASAPFPTVTLDLTQTPIDPLQFLRLQNSFQIPFPLPSPNSSASFLPQILSQALYNQSELSALQMSQDSGAPLDMQGAMADTLNAVTAAIAADPNFKAALAKAIRSIIGIPQSVKDNDKNNSNSSDKINSSSFSGN